MVTVMMKITTPIVPMMVATVVAIIPMLSIVPIVTAWILHFKQQLSKQGFNLLDVIFQIGKVMVTAMMITIMLIAHMMGVTVVVMILKLIIAHSANV